MQVKINWLEDRVMVAETGSGHALVMDGPPDFGGRNLGPRPMEMLLVGLGGCTEFDVLLMLQKSRQQVTGCQVVVNAERASEDPKVFRKIHLHYRISGRQIERKRVERAIQLSAEKYCSASVMLGAIAEISHDYEIVEQPD
jgi:putative redox protein